MNKFLAKKKGEIVLEFQPYPFIILYAVHKSTYKYRPLNVFDFPDKKHAKKANKKSKVFFRTSLGMFFFCFFRTHDINLVFNASRKRDPPPPPLPLPILHGNCFVSPRSSLRAVGETRHHKKKKRHKKIAPMGMAISPFPSRLTVAYYSVTERP